MPEPDCQNESRQEWMDRCMADEESRRDFPDEDQRAAFCSSRWESRCGTENKASKQMGTENLAFNYQFTNQSDGTAEVFIYDDIGDDFMGESVTAKRFADELKNLGDVESLNVRINSAGGQVFDAAAIYNQLANFDAPVTVNVDGMALSAASHIAMAGDTIKMAENAMMMIHDPMGIALGNSRDMRDTADTLDKIRDSIASVYVARTGQNRETINQLMADETWMTADEAKEQGFVDEVTEAKSVTASVDPTNIYNVPERFRHKFMNRTPGQSGSANTKGTDMSTQTQSIPSAAEFADANPDGAETLRAEGEQRVQDQVKEARNEGHNKGFDEGVKNERERCEALAKAFKDHPAFLQQQINKGHDVGKAKAEAFDAGIGQDEGAEPVNLDQSASVDTDATGSGDDKYANLDHDERIEREWEDNHNRCQSNYQNFTAYKAYRDWQAKRQAS